MCNIGDVLPVGRDINDDLREGWTGWPVKSCEIQSGARQYSSSGAKLT